MATPSAAVVFQGRDNTGAAAIVDSTQDTSFMDNMLNNIAKDAMIKRNDQKKAKEDLRKDMEEMQYDPLGQEPLDLEGESLVLAAEDYAVKAYKEGKDPMDVTTDEGREFLKLKRKAQMNAIQGKGAVNYYNLAMKGAGSDDVDQKRLQAWMNGYKDVQPNEGETLAMAKNRYVQQNPYAPMKPVGAYDFVTAVLPNVSRAKNGLVSALDKPLVMAALSTQLQTQEGQNVAERMMEDAGLDIEKEEDIQKFLENQYKLIEGKYPRQRSQGRSSSSNSSGGGRDDNGYVYKVTYSQTPEMWQNNKENNAIRLAGKDGKPLSLMPITSNINGRPISINKRSDGKLFLEYQVDDGEGGAIKKLIDYDLARDMIENLYGGRDIAEELTKGGKSDGKEKQKAATMSDEDYQQFLKDNGLAPKQ